MFITLQENSIRNKIELEKNEIIHAISLIKELQEPFHLSTALILANRIIVSNESMRYHEMVLEKVESALGQERNGITIAVEEVKVI